ncbi:Uncharacterized membrane protein [Haladaptatus litoreus]|uniref:Uncharacterized membrane protein n=1 Tax=Haladaptatus litoreus TaxID=553468 RepID=A0A1N7DMX1_9EURY|nr:DUF1616 domain-containing protein [Haladaptatus litoreus]SIR77180.1 Uncharacterized membrane protein [Haladaptatus litoreus]
MSTNSRWWFSDLVLVVGVAIFSGSVALTGLDGPLRVVFMLPLVLFLPGYAFISGLFPENGRDDARVFGGDKNEPIYAIGGPERVALAVTVSVAVVPMVAAIANFTPWGIRVLPILIGVIGFTILSALGAFVRRWRVPADKRYSLGLPRLLFNSAGQGSNSLTTILNVGIVISLLLVTSSVGFAVLSQPTGEQFTEFYVEGQNVNSNTSTFYQSSLGDDGITVNVGNHEGEQTQYTIVAVLERVEDGNIAEQTQFDQQQVTVESRQTKQVVLNGDPSISGDNVRVRLLLYKGDSSGNPHHVIRLWLSS